MSDRDADRYSHTSASGGSQDQGELKDDGWTSRQGGRQSHAHGRQGGAKEIAGDEARRPAPPARGTNTQGQLAGIGDASDASLRRLEAERGADSPRSADGQGVGDHPSTDQPPRMGGPLGPDPHHPHLPEGLQDGDERGSGAHGFDEGVDASRIGTLHQGVRPEDDDAAAMPGDPGAISGDPPGR